MRPGLACDMLHVYMLNMFYPLVISHSKLENQRFNLPLHLKRSPPVHRNTVSCIKHHRLLRECPGQEMMLLPSFHRNCTNIKYMLKPIVDLSFRDGLYNPSMAILGMIYNWVCHTRKLSLCGAVTTPINSQGEQFWSWIVVDGPHCYYPEMSH